MGDDRRALSRAATWYFVVSLAIALGLLVASAVRPYGLWPNTSDDFFYYLVLVRQSVLHGVVSADGLRPTNGFHPLYFLTLRALYPWVSEQVLPNVALGVLIAAHGVACLVLWQTLRRIAGPVIAGIVAGIYAANLAVLRIVFAAVETPLMVACLAACLWAHVRWLEDGARKHRVLALAALALAVAGRTDVVFLAAALALSPALAALRSRDLGRALGAVDWAPLVVAAVPIVCFGIWGAIATGEFVQTSGRSLSFWQSVGFWRQTQDALAGLGAARVVAVPLAYALVMAVQFVIYLLRGSVELLVFHPIGVLLVVAALAAWKNGRSGDTGGAPQGVVLRLRRDLILFQVLLWAFYALGFRHGQIWYWHGSIVVAALIAATWMAPLRAWLDRAHAPRGAWAIAIVLAVASAWLTLGRVAPHAPPSYHVVSVGSDPLVRVPDGAVLGAFDTGQLGWEQPRLVVVNLDGLVNNAAYHALRERRIGAYMLEQKIAWLYVHDKVIDRFRPFGLDAWLDRAEPVARSTTGVRLYRLR